eukprot:TRINITY_DN595_c0_g1_i1.p1 TRINITY_DN595_c0_g1~~TRINITY_DN595_c0_g1_i1.p1  ORF type:complete len:120 (+),score=25.43 TRINITY_DN595_c0_g1_i1:119-478(+)
MGVIHCLNMKVFIAIAALVAVSSGAPRYLVIPIEDVDFGNSNMAHRFPIYRMPALARQARAAQEEDSYQIAPVQRQYEPETSASNAYSAPPPPDLTMLTMELTPADMELSAGTLTTPSS